MIREERKDEWSVWDGTGRYYGSFTKAEAVKLDAKLKQEKHEQAQA